MRPHVELIDERDYIWHPAEFPHSTGVAEQRNLSYDEEDGSVSAKVRFVTDWSRPSGVHHAETEWFVLQGEVRIGAEVLRPGGYWMAPTGVLTPEISVQAGTELLFFRDYGDWRFDVASVGRADVRPDQVLVIVHSNEMDWIPVEIGSPMRFDLGGTPVPGLFIKMLHRDATTGFYSRLIKAQPDWVEHPLAHHPVMEEAYCLEGGFVYNYGVMGPGSYFFRPPLIRHGDFRSHPEDGCTWLVRCDGDLVDWYTNDARVEMHGTPVNWGPELPHTQPPALLAPVRSRSVKPMDDPSYV